MKVEKDWQNIEQKWTNETHHCRVVTLEFGAETRTLPPWLRVKREYRNDTYLFSTNPSQSFSVAIHKAEKIERSWGLKIKTTAQTLHKTQAVALQPDAEHASWLAQKSLKCTSLAFVTRTYSEKEGFPNFCTLHFWSLLLHERTYILEKNMKYMYE